jgi:uncharacterized membrane protein YhhN
MRLSTLLFLASVAVSAGFAIVAVARNDRAGVYLFKPLTTFIVLLGAGWLIRPAMHPFADLVVLGLALSLLGDVALMLPRDRFVVGLAAFLGAHLAYLAAFTIGTTVTVFDPLWLLPFLGFGAAVTWTCWPGLGKLKGPVLLYVAVIAAMAWRAAVRGHDPAVPRPSFLLSLSGACLFMGSDAVLAIRRFRRPFAMAQPLELAMYWAAQSLIALSVRG